MVCKRNQLILKPGELEMADDGRAEGGPPCRCNHVDSSSPRPRPSACLGRGSSRGCHPCPYFGRSRVLEMTESGIREEWHSEIYKLLLKLGIDRCRPPWVKVKD